MLPLLLPLDEGCEDQEKNKSIIVYTIQRCGYSTQIVRTKIPDMNTSFILRSAKHRERNNKIIKRCWLMLRRRH